MEEAKWSQQYDLKHDNKKKDEQEFDKEKYKQALWIKEH